MVGDIGQNSHLLCYMFYFYILTSILAMVYVSRYTIVTYALCLIITMYMYDYGTIS